MKYVITARHGTIPIMDVTEEIKNKIDPKSKFPGFNWTKYEIKVFPKNAWCVFGGC